MTTIDYAVEAGRARTLRQRVNLDQLDYRRELARLASLGCTQRQLSKVLGISQPSLSTALKTAQKVPAARAGFSGADPYEVCQRYSVGELTREQLIDELTRWEYATPATRERGYFDDLRFATPGSFDDVGQAFDDGLIDAEAYDTVLAAVAVEPR
ncbi:hypothetical protein AA310_00115 [Arthrobacter sp. YC-RL1]|uniref:hypothetical protein n=1 Tax=Arthrobacter sp. YC-RL1 TaxID=1652545 RepID=UPI00063DC53C|nr:hypothetical protein [Arthrobacter sp. YC-RL1]ALQ32644.1 hypothetical protein ATC04_18480 [Arthrobacter sp. YC-RL1]KLI90704.1 hypothetical protein AA310_00115 [Arthrobacter sp. YC-RL1]